MKNHFSGFVLAAHETTKSALSRFLYLLSQNQDKQEALREEILEAQPEVDGDLDYDTLMGLPFLDAVYRETLRCYPPLNSSQRT